MFLLFPRHQPPRQSPEGCSLRTGEGSCEEIGPAGGAGLLDTSRLGPSLRTAAKPCWFSCRLSRP